MFEQGKAISVENQSDEVVEVIQFTGKAIFTWAVETVVVFQNQFEKLITCRLPNGEVYNLVFSNNSDNLIKKITRVF